MTLIPPAKTPTTAVARALRDLGLKQGKGKDFRVAGHYQRGERRSTYVVVLNTAAEQTIADNADLIEHRTEIQGYPFTVSVEYSPAGRPMTTVSNDRITRVREQPPAITVHGEDDMRQIAARLRARTGNEQPAAKQLRKAQPGEDAGHCAQCARLLIWDRTGKRVHDEWGEYLCYGPDRVSTRSAVHILPEPEKPTATAASREPAEEVAEPAQQPEQPKPAPDAELDQRDRLPDFITVQAHNDGKAGEYKVMCARCEEWDRKIGRLQGRGEEPGRVAFRWGRDAQADAEHAAWLHADDHRTWARQAAEEREREQLREQAEALRWSEADARIMQYAASGWLEWWMPDGTTLTYYYDRNQEGAGPRVARGRVQALIAAGLLTAPDTDNPHNRAIRPTRDGKRALRAWNLCKPEPVVRTRKQDSEPRPYLSNGDEHRRRWEAAQRLMEETRQRVERAMLEHAARLEREEADEALDRHWRKECGILSPFAKRPADWYPSQPDPLDAALAQESARGMTTADPHSVMVAGSAMDRWAQQHRLQLGQPRRAVEMS
jgi:hypothetical protein